MYIPHKILNEIKSTISYVKSFIYLIYNHFNDYELKSVHQGQELKNK